MRRLDRPAAALPQLNRMADGVATPVTVLCGLSWAAFLAAYVSLVGDGLRASVSRGIVTAALDVTSQTFALATFTQFLQLLLVRRGAGQLISLVAYVALGLVTIHVVLATSQQLYGAENYAEFEEGQSAYDKVQCQLEYIQDMDAKTQRRDRAISDHTACSISVKTDTIGIRIAVGAKHLTPDEALPLMTDLRTRCDYTEGRVRDALADIKKSQAAGACKKK